MNTFLHPALLAGLALAAIPVVLHLIMRQKPKPLEFPPLLLLKLRKHANTRKLRLRHWLLLLLRIAAVCAMVLAVARPRIQATALPLDQEAPVSAALVFDTSPRMLYQQRNETRLAEARDLALWLLGQLPPESQAAVLDSSLTSSVFQVDLGAARQRVERLEPAAAAQPLSRVMLDAVRLLNQSERDRRELYVFTDCSYRQWNDHQFERVREALAQAVNLSVYVIDIGVDKPQNYALGQVNLSSQVVSKNSPLEVATDIARTGPAGERAVELYLNNADGKPVKRGGQTVKLAENQSQRVIFPLGGMDVGVHQGTINLVGDDGLGFDNIRFFTVEVRPAWRVLVAGPWPRPKDESVLHRSDLLIEALAPADLRRKDEARFNCTYVPLDELPQLGLKDYAAVCLLDPPPQPAEFWNHLRPYVLEGGSLAVFLGNRAVKGSFNRTEAQSLLPGELDFHGQASGADGVYFSPENFGHPMLSRFRAIDGGVPWNLFPVFKYWKLTNLHEGVQTVIPFNNGLPAVLERPVGKGRVMTMTTPITDHPSDDNGWNLLLMPDNWSYVMLVDQMMLYLVGGSEGRYNYQTGQTAVLKLDPEERVTQFMVTAPGKRQFRQTVDPQRRLLTIAQTGQAGQYRLQTARGEAGPQLGFSCNLPVEQSDLTRLPREGLQQVFGEFPYQYARNQLELVRAQGQDRVGQELFPYLLIALALVLALEFFMATRFYREV